MLSGGLVVIQAVILNGPHKDEIVDICPHQVYHDKQTEDGKLAEYKLAKVQGMYYLVHQGYR